MTFSINLSSLNGSNGFRLDGEAESDHSGTSASNAGDVNGDGFDDVIVGAMFADPHGNKSGSSYVVFGKASGFSAAMNLSNLDGSNGFRLDGEEEFDRSGWSVSTAGDVNGDGFDDVIIGAAGMVSDYYSSDSPGFSYVVFGKAAGFDATMDLSSLDGSNGFRLDGEKKYDFSGWSVSTAGDVNGDGWDDVIVGTPQADSNAHDSGSSYVVFGKAAGFDATMDLSSLDGSNGFQLDGEEELDHSGISVSNAGDMNGDGLDDVIIGAPGYGQSYHGYGVYSTGFSYVIFGKASGFNATLDLSSLDGSNGFRLNGERTFDLLGETVSTAGDVNGDGLDDVIVGASDSSYVVFGKASGFSATMNLSDLDGSNGFRLDGRGVPSTAGDVNGDGFDDVIVGALDSSYVVFGKASGFSATINLSSLDNSEGFGLYGGDLRVSAVGTAGDVNGDGFDDLMIGSPQNGADFSGSTYIIFGRSHFDEIVDFPGTPGDDNLIGTREGEIFDAGNGNDRMIGRGGADTFHGGKGADYIRVPDLDFQLVDGGAGVDILALSRGGLNLDLTRVHGKIHGIETIHLFGKGGDNTLTLTAAEVRTLSGTSNTLRVKGDAGDHIVGLSSGWTDGGFDGDGNHIYTEDGGGAVLLVGVNVTTDFVV